MLLEFRAKNYKSFKEKFVFSMQPTPKQHGLTYSILKKKVAKEEYKGLCSAVVYGPNASGKTNIISAIQCLKALVQMGKIKNIDERIAPHLVGFPIELIPNCDENVDTKTEFYIKFITNAKLVEYSLKIAIGGFCNDEVEKNVVFEELKINNKTIFTRNNKKLDINFTNIEKPNIPEGMKSESYNKALEFQLKPYELFFTLYLESVLSQELFSSIFLYFNKGLVVILNSQDLMLPINNNVLKEDTITQINNFSQLARILTDREPRVGFMLNKEDGNAEIVSILPSKENNEHGRAISAHAFESLGTIRLLTLYPLIRNALLYGTCLILDEFDASLHPMVIMEIINLFHDDEININGAQLIFNTHNPIFLDKALFRRDEIHFVEYDNEIKSSVHYILSDFGTAGKKGVRKDSNYMQHYMVDRYGAIKDISLKELFLNELTSLNEDNNAKKNN